MLFAIRELYLILADALHEALEAADLRARLAVWWWVVTHPQALSEPI